MNLNETAETTAEKAREEIQRAHDSIEADDCRGAIEHSRIAARDVGKAFGICQAHDNSGRMQQCLDRVQHGVLNRELRNLFTTISNDCV